MFFLKLRTPHERMLRARLPKLVDLPVVQVITLPDSRDCAHVCENPMHVSLATLRHTLMMCSHVQA